MLNDPDALSTLFSKPTYGEAASVVPGEIIPLIKPSVVVHATSSLLPNFDLKLMVSSRIGNY
jgi:hypothetical protein